MNFLLPLTGSFAQPAAENPTVAMIECNLEMVEIVLYERGYAPRTWINEHRSSQAAFTRQ